MSKIVFILGAGASKNAGAPLMKEFLLVAEDLMKEGRVDDSADEFALVFKGYYELHRVHAKSQMDQINVESVFAAFEMANQIGRLGSLNVEDIKKLPGAMKRVIERTLEMNIIFRWQEKRVRPPYPYDNFAVLVKDMIHSPKTDYNRVSIITFNYDVCLDHAFHWIGIPIDYSLNENDSDSGLKILKLHGSLNWAQCPGCDKVVAWDIGSFIRDILLEPIYEEGDEVHLNIGSSIYKFQHCDNSSPNETIIIPPTWNKAQYHNQLSPVWGSAAAELATAEHIYICGYSLPLTDHFFRYLFALGTIGDTTISRFWVFDPDSEVSARFQGLLGPIVKGGYEFQARVFEAAIDVIRARLEFKLN